MAINPQITRGLMEAGYQARSAAGRIAGAALSAGQSALTYANSGENKVLTAGLGLGAAGLGYGLYRMLGPSQYQSQPDYKEQAVVSQDPRRANRNVQTPQGQYAPAPYQPYATQRPNTIPVPDDSDVVLTKQDLLKAKMQQYRDKEKALKDAALANLYGNSLPSVNL
jgi:hypothetical protein